MFERFLIRLTITLFALVVWMSMTNPAKADVNYETWYCPSWPCPLSSNTLLSSGTWAGGPMNYNWGSGEVLDSGRSDYVVVHLDGYITVPIPFNGSAGDSVTVTFYNQDDDGSLLKIDGTTVIDDWSGLHGPATRSGTITLQAGETYSYERWFAEWGGGAVLRQLWLVPGYHGSWTWVSATHNIATTVTSYSSSISSAQTQDITDSRNVTHSGNGIYINQVGSNNTLNVTQDGTDNLIAGGTSTTNTIVKSDITGNNNTTTMTQRGDNNAILFDITGDYNSTTVDQGGAAGSDGNRIEFNVNGDHNVLSLTQRHNNGVGTNGHYLGLDVDGNYNNILTGQKDDGDKKAFISVQGNSNDIDLLQQGSGSHYVEIEVGSNQTVDVTQDGTGNHNASISMDGYAAGLDLTQDGSTGQTYSLDQTCLNANGCGTTTLLQQ